MTWFGKLRNDDRLDRCIDNITSVGMSLPYRG